MARNRVARCPRIGIDSCLDRTKRGVARTPDGRRRQSRVVEVTPLQQRKIQAEAKVIGKVQHGLL